MRNEDRGVCQMADSILFFLKNGESLKGMGYEA